MDTPRASDRKVRYAVVGLGHIAQVAVLPAFAHARENSELTALVSDDQEKLRALSARYRVSETYPYAGYEACLRSGDIDAVYIALPNHLHAEYAVRAAEAGVHVLCEKPMAVTEAECEEMIGAAEDHGVKLMIAYRLHFEEANLKAVELAQAGRLGELRLFDSTFTQVVTDPDNIRLSPIAMGGGAVYDIGIYCINAARYLFRAEPTEVAAFSVSNPHDSRFHHCDEVTAVLLRFPDERLASFVCSFGAADVSRYRLVGTRGDLRVEPAYDYATRLCHYLTIDELTKRRVFSKRDQFAPELLYFSSCVLGDIEPEPSGWEGLADVRIIRAIHSASETHQAVPLAPFTRPTRPSPDQEIHKPPVAKPDTVHARGPSS
jgi:glucose-fructose oxidoreductase